MSATGKGGRRDGGFTLLEMLVTVAILALISGIGFAQLQTMLARQAMTAARSAVALAVAQARGRAVRDDRVVQLRLADRGDALVVSGLAAIPLPDDARLEWPRDGLAMFGDGSSSGAAGVLRAGAASSRFAIDPDTAQLRFAVCRVGIGLPLSC